MQSDGPRMPGKKLAYDFRPGRDNFLLTQARFQAQFRRKLDKDVANREHPIRLFLGLRETAPLLDHPFTERLRRHKKRESENKSQLSRPDRYTRPSQVVRLTAIAADGFHGASLHGLFAQSFLVRAFRLFIDIGMTAVIVARKIRGSRLTA